ncbi:MAG: heme-copper oxidase subunit III [Deltaproteobacteria bacterium]|nr:MAG: heme-copper oxidase subunit III [Deltaproteobacteria bacterium]
MSAPGIAIETKPLVPSGLLAVAIFVASEAIFFAALISAFVVLRAQALDWPPFDQPRLPVLVTGINTAILLLSGCTIHGALRSVRASGARLTGWLAATAVLGALFLAIQGYEWVRLVGFGLTTSSSLYGATFYALVGAHGVHVLAALVVVLVVAVRGYRGRYGAAEHTGVAMCHLYWLFVVAVWPVLYALVYLR